MRRDGVKRAAKKKHAPEVESKAPVEVKAGEVYSAPARQGMRHIRVEQVRRPQYQQPYVLAREVTGSGDLARGWLHGVRRDEIFTVALTFDAATGIYKMPGRYALKFEE